MAGPDFPAWISRVVQRRRAMEAQDTPDELLLRRERAILDGLDESFNAGVAVLADIVTSPWRQRNGLGQIALAQTQKYHFSATRPRTTSPRIGQRQPTAWLNGPRPCYCPKFWA